MSYPSASHWQEEAALLGASRSLVGLVTTPPAGAPRRDLGVLLLDAGLVHHVGPHRLHVHLARRLAARGFAVVRFDFSGIGDSPPRRDSIPQEQSAVVETREVMDQMAERWGLDRFVLAGICSGASVSFKVASEDRRVAGAVLINPRSYSPSRELDEHLTQRGLARYYIATASRDPRRWRRLLTPAGWRKLLSVAGSQIRQVFERGRLLEQESRRVAGEIRALNERGQRLLFLFSEGDAGLDLLQLILGRRYEELGDEGPTRRVIVPRSDHTFTLDRSQQRLHSLVEEFLEELAPTVLPVARGGEDGIGDSGEEREELFIG